jgi:hypothetical protein
MCSAQYGTDKTCPAPFTGSSCSRANTATFEHSWRDSPPLMEGLGRFAWGGAGCTSMPFQGAKYRQTYLAVQGRAELMHGPRSGEAAAAFIRSGCTLGQERMQPGTLVLSPAALQRSVVVRRRHDDSPQKAPVVSRTQRRSGRDRESRHLRARAEAQQKLLRDSVDRHCLHLTNSKPDKLKTTQTQNHKWSAGPHLRVAAPGRCRRVLHVSRPTSTAPCPSMRPRAHTRSQHPSSRRPPAKGGRGPGARRAGQGTESTTIVITCPTSLRNQRM